MAGREQLTLLEQDALKQRVLVPEHQALVGGVPVGSLQVVQVLLVHPDRLFELLDVFGASFAEGGLCLAVPLLTFLGRSINLAKPSVPLMYRLPRHVTVTVCSYRLTGLRPPLRFTGWPSWELDAVWLLPLGACMPSSPESSESSESCLMLSFLSMDIMSAISSMCKAVLPVGGERLERGGGGGERRGG